MMGTSKKDKVARRLRGVVGEGEGEGGGGLGRITGETL